MLLYAMLKILRNAVVSTREILVFVVEIGIWNFSVHCASCRWLFITHICTLGRTHPWTEYCHVSAFSQQNVTGSKSVFTNRRCHRFQCISGMICGRPPSHGNISRTICSVTIFVSILIIRNINVHPCLSSTLYFASTNTKNDCCN